MINIISKILDNINAIIKYVENTSYEEFVDDELLIDAVMFRLIQMVENIKGLTPEYKNNHSKIKWGLIIGFRNGIVHDYNKTDYSIVYDIVTKDIKELKDELEMV